MAWLQGGATQEIFNLLDGETQRTRAVGGIVRDSLMGRNLDKVDIDFATELLPKQVIERAIQENIAYYPTGIEHGTVTLRIGEKTFEITTLRQDIKTYGRHAKVSFGTDWLVDAKRRDFTFNALYANFDGTLYDPLSGLNDCLMGRVRFIGNADQRIREDYLRVYRFFRFCATHGGQEFDEEGLAACKRAVNNLGNISHERIGVEMMRMLQAKKVAKSLKIMNDIGVVSFDKKIISWLFAYEDMTNKPKSIARLAILLHQYQPSILQNMWRLSNAQIKLAVENIKGAKMLGEGKLNEAAYYCENISDILPLAASIFSWNMQNLENTHKKMQEITVPEFPISGKILLEAGMKEGAEIGRTLALLKTEWINSGFSLTKKQLLSKI